MKIRQHTCASILAATLVWMVVAGFAVTAPAGAVVWLDAGFDDKAVDQPIGTGGPDVGEPISVSGAITAHVRGTPTPTPILDIADNDDYSAGSARFEFVGGAEPTSGGLVIYANLWFPANEDLFLYVRERGTSARQFTNLRFTAAGNVTCSDANSSAWTIGSYVLNRHFPVYILYNLDAGTYDVWFGGTLVVSDEPHGVTGRGVGAVLVGCSNDADLDGHMYVEDLYVGDRLPPTVYLRANFNYEPLDVPIDQGGPEIGQPVRVDPTITAIVRGDPILTPSLEIHDGDDYGAGFAWFDFIYDAEVLHGTLVIGADLHFAEYGNYSVAVREHESAAHAFSDLMFVEAGYMVVQDAGGITGDWCYYDIGRIVSIRIVHDLEAGTYDVWYGDLQVTDDEPHGVTGRGIGQVLVGCINDADTTGTFYVDNLWVATGLPPAQVACCLDTNCADVTAMDCAFAGGVHHPEWAGCGPNPCLPSAIAELDPAGPGTGRGVRPVLLPVHPSPFRVTTRLAYFLPRAGDLRIEVHDAAGRLVRALRSGPAPAGPGAATWDGCDARGIRVAPGTYFARLTAGAEEATGRLLIVK
jgi:hypothetical protein